MKFRQVKLEEEGGREEREREGQRERERERERRDRVEEA